MSYQAYLGIKYHADNRNKDQIEALTNALLAEGIKTICIARDVEAWGRNKLPPAELMRIAFEQIDKADFVLLEMSEKGVGLGIEAGYAAATGKPIIVLTQHKENLSPTLLGVAGLVVEYHAADEIQFKNSVDLILSQQTRSQ